MVTDITDPLRLLPMAWPKTPLILIVAESETTLRGHASLAASITEWSEMIMTKPLTVCCAL